MALTALGVSCAAGSLFTSTLYISVPLVVASLFCFAAGWDGIKDARNAAVVSGVAQRPTMPFPVKDDLRLELVDQDGILRASTRPDQQGAFVFSDVPDGVWTVRASSTWLDVSERRIEVHRRQKLDVGAMPLKFGFDKLWKRELVPQISQITSAIISSDGTLWALGFLTENKVHNNRKIMCKRAGDSWKEIIVPPISSGERGTFIYELSDRRLLVGSLGAGAAFSDDFGRTWKKVALPKKIDSVLTAIELPDKSILALGWEWNRGNALACAAVRFTNDLTVEPVITTSLEKSQFTSVFLTEPGRVLAGYTSLSNGGGILVSEDFGDTWKQSPIAGFGRAGEGVNSILGVNAFCETPKEILSGTLDGKKFRCDHMKNGLLLTSADGGVGWKKKDVPFDLSDVCGFCRIDKNTIGLLTKLGSHIGTSKILISSDNGSTWKEFIDAPAGGPTATLIDSGEKCLVFGLNTIATANKADLRWDRFA